MSLSFCCFQKRTITLVWIKQKLICYNCMLAGDGIGNMLCTVSDNFLEYLAHHLTLPRIQDELSLKKKLEMCELIQTSVFVLTALFLVWLVWFSVMCTTTLPLAAFYLTYFMPHPVNWFLYNCLITHCLLCQDLKSETKPFQVSICCPTDNHRHLPAPTPAVVPHHWWVFLQVQQFHMQLPCAKASVRTAQTSVTCFQMSAHFQVLW